MSDSSIPVSKRNIHKQKVAEQQFEDQLSDLWYLQEKKNRLNREELFKNEGVENESQISS
jgi:hypothetical protein